MLTCVLNRASGERVPVMDKASLNLLRKPLCEFISTAVTGAHRLNENPSVVLRFPLLEIGDVDVPQALASGKRNLLELLIESLFSPFFPLFRVDPIFLQSIDLS